MKHYWPKTMLENDMETWCQSMSSRIDIFDSDKLQRTLLMLAWTPQNETGWLTAMMSGKKARHKWTALGQRLDAMYAEAAIAFLFMGSVEVWNSTNGLLKLVDLLLQEYFSLLSKDCAGIFQSSQQ